MSETTQTNTALELELVNKQLELVKARQAAEFALSPAGQQLQLMKSEQEAKLALTPVGQELQRFQINQRMGQMYASSSLVPDTYRGNVANCAIAIDMATRMNANALMVMQNLYIVHGNPRWSSQFLISTVNHCGRFEPLQFRFYTDGKIGRHDYWENDWKINDQTGRKEKVSVKKTFDGTKIDNLCCVAFTTVKGSDKVLESSVISCRLAVQEGWWTKNQSKWPTMTQQMLMYRAAAFWQRTYAPEISMGFSTVEEAHDIEDVAFEDVTPDAIPSARRPRSISDLAREAAINTSAPAAQTVEAEPVPPAPVDEDIEAAFDSMAGRIDPETGEVKADPIDPTSPTPGVSIFDDPLPQK